MFTIILKWQVDTAAVGRLPSNGPRSLLHTFLHHLQQKSTPKEHQSPETRLSILIPICWSTRWKAKSCNWRIEFNFMIELFFFSLYFWSRYWTYLSSTFDPLGSFSRTAHVIRKQQWKWSKNLHFHKKKSESWRGIFTKIKTSKSPVAFSLTCTLLWPEWWPPEPPSWSCFGNVPKKWFFLKNKNAP